jgi:hypothetical protein
MLVGTAGVAPSSNGVATDAIFTSVSDSEKSSLCLATGSFFFISCGDAFTVAWAEKVLTSVPVPTDVGDSDAEPTSDTTAVFKMIVSLKLKSLTTFSYTNLRLFYSTIVLRVWETKTPRP